jgi:hypothetical protein
MRYQIFWGDMLLIISSTLQLSDHPIFLFIVSLVLEYNLNATVFCHNLSYARTYFYFSVNLDIDAKTITPLFGNPKRYISKHIISL